MEDFNVSLRIQYAETTPMITAYYPSLVLLLSFSLLVNLVALCLDANAALFSTVSIFSIILTFGLWQCSQTAKRLSDSKLKILGLLWLIKLGLTLFLLYVGWIPQLYPESSDSWGYDPQRFYFDAYDLAENNWAPVVGSNYNGIIYYYGIVFYLFGHNPIIPALINSIITLLGTLFLIRSAYEFKQKRSQNDWIVAFLIIIPEVLWYDVITCREALAPILLLVTALSFGRYLTANHSVSLMRTMIVGGGCFAGLLAIRTSLAIPIMAIVVIITFSLRSSRGPIPKLLIITLAICVTAAGPFLQQLLGGYQVDYLASLNVAQTFDENIASSSLDWTENSIGLLLAPNNALEAILFLIPRMILYLVAPLPRVSITLNELSSGSWLAWQSLFTALTSVSIIFCFPYVLAGFYQAVKNRIHWPSPLVLYISFWVTFAAVVGGNIIIHERYRLMATLLLFTSAWLGYTTCNKSQALRARILWFGTLSCYGAFFVAIKYL